MMMNQLTMMMTMTANLVCWGSINVICRWSLPVCPWYYFGDALMIV